MSDSTDAFADLLVRARQGDPLALTELVRQYEPEICTVARVHLGLALRPFLDSMDLVQSVHKSLLLALQQGKFQLQTPQDLVALTVTMVRRKVAQHWRGGSFSGRIFAGADVGMVLLGDLVGGSADGNSNLAQSGYIGARRIATLTIAGSVLAGMDNTSGSFVNNGAIRVADELGSVTVKGSLIGNSTNAVMVSARGQALPSATTDIAIGPLSVLGRVEHALILAGVDPAGTPLNADAMIGKVSVGGDWIASSIAAGANAGPDTFFGTNDDFSIRGAGVKDLASMVATITNLTIGGQALGSVGGNDAFGIVAQKIAAVTIGGTALPLLAGNGNDDVFVGITGDFKVQEI